MWQWMTPESPRGMICVVGVKETRAAYSTATCADASMGRPNPLVTWKVETQYL